MSKELKKQKENTFFDEDEDEYLEDTRNTYSNNTYQNKDTVDEL